MKVTTVAASVRFSKAMGDGQHKTIELSAEAALDANEAWTDAQSSLYHELGQQLKALWGNGTQPSNTSHSVAPAHYCQQHQTEFKQYSKGNQVWYAHKLADNKWCKEK